MSAGLPDMLRFKNMNTITRALNLVILFDIFKGDVLIKAIIFFQLKMQSKTSHSVFFEPH